MTSLAWARRRADRLLAQHLGADWSFDFDHARARVGCCDFQARRITVSRHLTPDLSQEQFEQAVLHEIAHALAGAAAHHGPLWRQTADRLGYHGRRTFDLPQSRQRARWLGTCRLGHELLRHRRPPAGACCGECARSGLRHRLVWQDRRLEPPPAHT
ncbi:MAG: SprT-like domain-containing protein [Propionibacteriaceae bacterium]|jgi:predicted SprT family Zn-dependent metalloprotease|nr:SprT-like domain-containing protein [Propionibacteriaceae bacterium]